MDVARWRLAAAAAMIAVLIAAAVVVMPSYVRNHDFQHSISAIVEKHPEADDQTLIASVVESAEKLGLPVKADQVRVRRYRPGSFQVEAPYKVQVWFPLFALDLHFHPQARR